MKSLTATLLAAQQNAPFSVPIVRAEIFNRVGSVSRISWELLDEGAEADYFNSSCMPSNGSLIRVRTVLATDALKYDLVEDPDAESSYGNWSDFGHDAYANACCAYGTNVLVFFIDKDDGHLYRIESDDSGDTWDARVDMGDVSGDATFRLACCWKDADEAIVLYSNGSTIYRSRLSSGSWEAFSVWSNSLASISGITVYYAGDWNVFVTGIDGDSQDGIWATLYGDGYSAAVGSWSSLQDLIVRDSADPYTYAFPTLCYPDVFRVFFVEARTQSTTYNRLYFSHSLPAADYISNLWREPVPFNHSCEYGASLVYRGSYAWLTTNSHVYRGSLPVSAIDVSSDIVSLTQRQLPVNYSSYLRLELDNTGGKYNDFDKLGQAIYPAFGYHTSAGDEYVASQIFWITGWEFRSPPWFPLRAIWPQGVEGTIVIYAEDFWSVLHRWKARRPFEWEADDMNIFQMLSFIFSKVGLEFSSFSASSAMVNTYPAFKIPEGYNGKWAVKKLMSWVQDQLLQLGDTVYLKNIPSTEASCYTYDSVFGNATIVYRGHYGTHRMSPNRVEVYGDTFMAEDQEWPEIEDYYDDLKRITTPDYDSVGDATLRASGEIRKAESIPKVKGWMQTVWNVGQDPWDVVTVTDVPGGITSRDFRILGIYTYYDARIGSQLQKHLLGEP